MQYLRSLWALSKAKDVCVSWQNENMNVKSDFFCHKEFTSELQDLALVKHKFGE